MIKRALYNIGFYYMLLRFKPFESMVHHNIKVWFILYAFIMLNIALFGRNRWKHIGICSAFVLGPFFLMNVIDSLVGKAGNIYNKHIDVYCQCDQTEHIYYMGYIYMAISLGIYIIWRIVDQSREYTTSKSSLTGYEL